MKSPGKLFLRSMVRLFCVGVLFAGSSVFLSAQDADTKTIESSGGYVKNRGNSKVIVFVHGLFSGPDAWRCDAQNYWPEMIARDEDPVFAQADIYVVKYPTPTKHGTMTLADLASTIYNRMVTDGIFSRHKEVIFVAHSMGGILTQQLMITYVNERLSDKVHAIFLYGTPQEGSRLANIGKLFSRDPLLKELQAGDDNLILPDMDQKWHHGGASQIKRFCAYETSPEDGFKVVSRNSATRGCDDSLAINSNHRDLVKPCNKKMDSYTFLANKLRETAVSPHETAPLVPAQYNSLVQPESTPFSEVERVLNTVVDIAQTYSQSAQRVGQDFTAPYKTWGGPMPATLPDELLERLVAADRQASDSYATVQPQIMKVRHEAINCFQLTPNQLANDEQEFRTSYFMALRTTPVNQLEQNRSGVDRFRLIIEYLKEMHRKLGDYRCGMY